MPLSVNYWSTLCSSFRPLSFFPKMRLASLALEIYPTSHVLWSHAATPRYFSCILCKRNPGGSYIFYTIAESHINWPINEYLLAALMILGLRLDVVSCLSHMQLNHFRPLPGEWHTQFFLHLLEALHKILSLSIYIYVHILFALCIRWSDLNRAFSSTYDMRLNAFQTYGGTYSLN